MNLVSRSIVISTALFFVVLNLVPVLSTSAITFTGTGFEEVYVVVRDREVLDDENNNWFRLKLEVVGNYVGDDDSTTLSDGDVVYFGYDRTADPEYHELKDGAVLQIDCNLELKKAITPTGDYNNDNDVISISSMEEASLPPSMWRYYMPPLVIAAIVVSIIVTVAIIVFVIHRRRRIKKIHGIMNAGDRTEMRDPGA